MLLSSDFSLLTMLAPFHKTKSFCVFGMFQEKWFQNNPKNIQQLKTNLTLLITGVTRASLNKVPRNVLKRANSHVNADGGLCERLN